MAAIFYHDAEQQRIAEKGRDKLAEKGKVHTQIRPAIDFYQAEDYHQKYYLQHRNFLMAELKAIYPVTTDFVNSTAVSRLNGYVAGYGSAQQLALDIDQLGLSQSAREKLRNTVSDHFGLTKSAGGCQIKP